MPYRAAMKLIERRARTLLRDEWVHPTAPGQYRVTDPEHLTVYTVVDYRCDCPAPARSCVHAVAVLAYENRLASG